MSQEIGRHRLCFSEGKTTTLILKNCHIIQHGLQGFIVKNIKGESMEADTSNF